jgi:hypothetical protein
MSLRLGRRVSNSSIELVACLCGVRFAIVDLLLNLFFDLGDLLFRWIADWLLRRRTLALADWG